MTNEELQQQIEQLEQQIKDIKMKLESNVEKEPYEVEVPEDVDDCYTTGIYGSVDRLENFSTPYKEGCYKRGLIFKTREQAEQHDKELILLFKLHKWAEEQNGGWTPNWKENNDKHYVTYHYGLESFQTTCEWRENIFYKLPYFKSEGLARKFIEEFGEEIKEVFC